MGNPVSLENGEESVSINAVVSDGQLVVPFIYDACTLTEAEVQQWADGVVSQLKAIVEHCGSISDLRKQGR